MDESFNKPIAITEVIGRVRGGSQGHTVRCEDGRFYVAKFAGNPQGSRTLINEWIVAHVMDHLGISTPRVRILHLPQSVKEESALYFSVGNKLVPVSGDFHFGSAYPVDPLNTAIFDLLPARLLPKVVNLHDYAATWVLDKFLYNADRRQSVFIRAKGASSFGMQAFMIDHGQCFNGVRWEILETSFCAYRWNCEICQQLDMAAESARCVAKIAGMSPDVFLQAAQSFPATWLAPNDRELLDALLQSVMIRRGKIAVIIERHLDALLQD